MIVVPYISCLIGKKVKKIIYSKINHIITNFNFIVANMIFLFYTCSAKRQ